MEAFLLGLSNGGVCLAYCAPVLVPCLLAGSGGGIPKAVGITAGFLGGRLLGYLVFAVAAWIIGRALLGSAGARESIIGLAYMMLSVMLVVYAFTAGRSHSCAATGMGALMLKLSEHQGLSPLLPVAAGVATGLNFCPPFLLALPASAEKGSLSYSIFFFFMFFLGTSLFFVPAPFFGLLRSHAAVRTVGRLCGGLVGAYYFFSGLIMLTGGIKSL